MMQETKKEIEEGNAKLYKDLEKIGDKLQEKIDQYQRNLEEVIIRPNYEWEQQQESQEEIDKGYQQEDQGYESPIESYWDNQYWEEMAEPDEIE